MTATDKILIVQTTIAFVTLPVVAWYTYVTHRLYLAACEQSKIQQRQLDAIKEARKRDAADRVVARWHQLLLSRNRVFKWANEERDRTKPIPIFPSDFGTEVAPAIIDMMNFFEEWGSLERAGAIDSAYIGTILGFHADWFYRNVFREVSMQVRERKKLGAKHELVEPLAICWIVFKTHSRQDKPDALASEAAMAALHEIK